MKTTTYSLNQSHPKTQKQHENMQLAPQKKKKISIRMYHPQEKYTRTSEFSQTPQNAPWKQQETLEHIPPKHHSIYGWIMHGKQNHRCPHRHWSMVQPQ